MSPFGTGRRIPPLPPWRLDHEHGTDAVSQVRRRDGAGFIVDHHAGGKRLVSTWVEGAPEKSRWWSGAAKVPADKCLPVSAFRCSVCGFLESCKTDSTLRTLFNYQPRGGRQRPEAGIMPTKGGSPC